MYFDFTFVVVAELEKIPFEKDKGPVDAVLCSVCRDGTYLVTSAVRPRIRTVLVTLLVSLWEPLCCREHG